MRRFVPLLAAVLMGAMTVAQAQAPAITAPGVFVPPDLSKNFVPGGYQLGSDVVKDYHQRGATRTVLRDYAGMTDSLPTWDDERNIPIEGMSIPVDKTGADLFKTSHRDAPFTVFTAEIKSEDAVAMRLCLDLGHLRHGEEVWLASPDTGETFGPYYSHNNHPDGLWLPRVNGDTTLLIVRSLSNETPAMALKHVAHMYVPLQDLPAQFACITNVACENDAGVQQVRTGVGLLSFGIPVGFAGGRFFFQFSLCTGNLLNNPVTDAEEPFFLTANHCIDDNLVASTGEVIWDWESNQCFDLNIPRDSDIVRVPVYLDRGELYTRTGQFGLPLMPATMQFRLSFNENVLAFPGGQIIFEPNPRLAEWYGKTVQVTRPPPATSPFQPDPGTLLFQIQRAAHVGPILAVDYSADGAFLVTGGGDGTARLWNAQLGSQAAVYIGHTGAVNSVAISPDNSLILTGSDDGTARLWDRETGEEIRQFAGHEDAVNAVAFSPNGLRALTGSSDELAKLWLVATGAELQTFGGDPANEGDPTHSGAITGVAFAPNGNQVLTGSSDNTAILWDAATADPIVLYGGDATPAGHSEGITSVDFSADGARIATSSEDQTAKMWNAATGEVQLTFAGHVDVVNSVAFSPNGAFVVTASADGTGRVWNTTNALQVQLFAAHGGPVNEAVFSPDSSDVASVSDDGTLRRWSVETGATIILIASAEITTFDNQLPIPIPEPGTPQENPFLLGQLVLVDVGGTGTGTNFNLFSATGSSRFFQNVPLATCNGSYTDSGAGGCVRYPDDLTIFIPHLSRFSLPRSKVECVLATNSLVDATLLRLGASRGLYADDPVEPAHTGRFYAGWTTAPPQVGDQVFNVSHPAGFDKKFAAGVIIDTSATRRIGRFAYEDQIGVDITRGLILGGSSGSGWFLDDGSLSLIGITSNGPGNATCAMTGPVYFGSFAAFFPDIEEYIYRPNPPSTCLPFPFTTDSLRDFRAMPIRDTGRIVLTWQRPTIEPDELILVRRANRFPRTPSDGTQISLDTIAATHIDEGQPVGQELFYGLFALYGGQSSGQRQFARVVVGDATGAVTYEPLAEEFDPVLNPFDLSFSQLTFVPLIDFREVASTDFPRDYVNLSNYHLHFQSNVFRFPVERGQNAIPLPFRELETISGRGANFISGPSPVASQFLFKLPNPVPLFGEFNRDLIISAQGFLTFNSPSNTVGLTQGSFSPLLEPSYASHFRLPRVSFLFGELSPQAGGSAWMRIMDDRIVVAFEDIPEWPTFPPRRSSVQTELFHNGQVRMTFLQVNAQNLVVGLSDGRGTPIDPGQADLVFPGRLMSKLSGFSEPAPLQLTPIPILMVREGETVNYTPAVAVPPGSPAPSFSAVDAPFGLTVNANTGAINWATGFTDAGLYQFDLVVTSGALATSQRVVVIVENVNRVPVTSTVEVIPAVPTEDDFLRIEWDYTHPDGIPEGPTRRSWFRDGQLVYALINETFVPDFVTRPGERWYAEVVPVTVTGLEGAMVRSNVVFIAPSGGFDPNGDKFDADVNQDGVVNAVDVQLVINTALSGVKSNPRTDINRDGKVNAIDVQLVINGALD